MPPPLRFRLIPSYVFLTLVAVIMLSSIIALWGAAWPIWLNSIALLGVGSVLYCHYRVCHWQYLVSTLEMNATGQLQLCNMREKILDAHWLAPSVWHAGVIILPFQKSSTSRKSYLIVFKDSCDFKAFHHLHLLTKPEQSEL